MFWDKNITCWAVELNWTEHISDRTGHGWTSKFARQVRLDRSKAGQVSWLQSATRKVWLVWYIKQVVAVGKVIYTKYSKHWLYTVAHTIECVCSKINNSWFNPWFTFYFSSLYPAPYKVFCILVSFRLSFIWLKSVFILSLKHKAKDKE